MIIFEIFSDSKFLLFCTIFLFDLYNILSDFIILQNNEMEINKYNIVDYSENNDWDFQVFFSIQNIKYWSWHHFFFYTNDGIEAIYNESNKKLLCHLVLEYFVYSVIQNISLTLESVLFASHTEALLCERCRKFDDDHYNNYISKISGTLWMRDCKSFLRWDDCISALGLRIYRKWRNRRSSWS